VAVPRTSVQPPRTEAPPRQKKEGLDVQTLVIAAVSSGIAAVVVAHFWHRGTIFASAMTPVVVAVVSDMLKRPVQSERLRSSVRSVSSFNRPSSGRTPKVMAPPTPGVDEGLEQRENGVEAGPVRVYSSGTNKRPRATSASPRRRLHLKIAVITGLIAFLIAAAALTLPELLFGGSVAGSHRSTTYFGGGSSSSDKSKSEDNSGDNQDGSSSQDQQQDQSPSDSGSSQQPDQSTPTSPDSTTPQQTTPQSTPPPTTQSPTPSAPATPSP
jgi:hypothetical protein